MRARMMRSRSARLGACALAVFLMGALMGAKPSAPPPPPAVGITVAASGGARVTDAVLPGQLLDIAMPRGANGRPPMRHVLALVTPDDPASVVPPKGPRALYRIDPERPGTARKLLDGLPPECNALAAADLGGAGGENRGEEILLGAPGKIWTLGSPDAPTAPRLLLEAAGLDLRLWSAGAPFRAVEAGRLRTWTPDVDDTGRLVAGPEQSLPVTAAREGQALRLSSLPVTLVANAAGPEGAPPLQAIGPEDNGKVRLRTVLLGPDGERTEAWAQLPGKEKVESFLYAFLDGQPALIVTTSDADTIGLFGKQRFRLYLLNAGRGRAGQPPSLAFETETHFWFPVDPVLADLDRDGKQDLVVIQPEGLGGGDLMIDTFFGQGSGGTGRFERPRRVKLGNLEARLWSYSRDLTGDGAPDLVTLSKDGVRVFARTADPRKSLLDRRPFATVPLAGGQESVSVSVTVGGGASGTNLETTRAASIAGPHLEDLDGDGRPEILIASTNAGGRGRVKVVRLGR